MIQLNFNNYQYKPYVQNRKNNNEALKPLNISTTYKNSNSEQKSNLSFKGITRFFVAKNKPRIWFAPKNFKLMIDTAKSKVIGKPPKDLIDLFSNNPENLFKFLDELAILRNSFKENDKLTLILNSGKKVSLEYLGDGGYGNVFKFNEKYTIKFYRSNNFDCVDGVYPEINTGLYSSDKEYADLSKFYFGNPDKKWAVFQYIDEEVARIKEKLPDRFRNKNYVKMNDDGYDNNIKQVRIDYGGIVKTKGLVLSDLIDQIKNLQIEKNGLNKFDELQEIVLNKHPECLPILIDRIRFLPSGEDIDKFNQLQEIVLNKHPECLPTLIDNICWVLPAGKDKFNKLQEVVLNKYPECLPNIIDQIKFLPGKDRIDKFNELQEIVLNKYPKYLPNLIEQIKFFQGEKNRIDKFNKFQEIVLNEYPECLPNLIDRVNAFPIGKARMDKYNELQNIALNHFINNTDGIKVA